MQVFPNVPRRQGRPRRAAVAALRAEARLIATAGLILLAVGFPLTLALAALALAPNGLSPLAPLLSGGPLVGFGWAACRYASWRLEQAGRLEQAQGDAFASQNAQRSGADKNL